MTTNPPSSCPRNPHHPHRLYKALAEELSECKSKERGRRIRKGETLHMGRGRMSSFCFGPQIHKQQAKSVGADERPVFTGRKRRLTPAVHQQTHSIGVLNWQKPSPTRGFTRGTIVVKLESRLIFQHIWTRGSSFPPRPKEPRPTQTWETRRLLYEATASANTAEVADVVSVTQAPHTPTTTASYIYRSFWTEVVTRVGAFRCP